MTSTPHVTGLFNDSKPSSKVLRPPGGGTSDIFGSSDNQAQTPRAVRNHMASNIFGNDQQNSVKNNGDSVRRSQKNIDSYSRLFGEPERPMTPAKNHMRSNIPIGPNATATTVVDGKETNGSSTQNSFNSNTSSTNGHHNGRNGNKIENGGDHHQNGVSKTDGNPVTGEGYKPAGTEINTSVPALNGANQVIIKNRVPPGGYSSGLW